MDIFFSQKKNVQKFECLADILKECQTNYDENEEWTHNLLPFLIKFVDYDNIEINNKSCYIANIHKIDNISGQSISGSNMVLFVLKLIKQLGIKSAILGDGATIKCNGMKISLSFLKPIFFEIVNTLKYN